MSIITTKAEVVERLNKLPAYDTTSFLQDVHTLFLQQKIRFPLLEFTATQLQQIIPPPAITQFTDAVISLNSLGGFVITGTLLQKQLNTHFEESFQKASQYIISRNEWYVCDIIAERVFGYALLHNPEKTIPYLHEFKKHPNKWMIRSVGVAIHYATKKGLNKTIVSQLFQLLLSCANTTDFHTKKGIGWAAKTIAKFYPDIVHTNHQHIFENSEIKQWFKTKITIGLSRKEKYAAKYPG